MLTMQPKCTLDGKMLICIGNNQYPRCFHTTISEAAAFPERSEAVEPFSADDGIQPCLVKKLPGTSISVRRSAVVRPPVKYSLGIR